ncbi:MAG: hypothetical protein RBR18_16525, partial [Desulfovibrionaceae bacterium]|nr:hypothetical protein [Desulfovibrionaceae bacterium]
MTTQDMINTIRAGKRLGHRALAEIADRLEEQDSYLRSALATLQEQAQLVTEQEEQLRGLGGLLAESEQHRRILATQNSELLARCDLLEAENMDRQEQSADMERCLAKALDHMVTVQS